MKKNIIVLILSVFILTGGACQFKVGKEKKEVPADAGVYKTINAGEEWKQIKLVPSISGSPGSIAKVSVYTMEMDPQDNKAIYLGTERSGIYYTYDGGARWNHIKSFPKGKVYSIKVNPDNKCVIYATSKNSIKKTIDCGRTWETIFVDNDTKISITALAIDLNNANIIYAGTSKGVIHKSFDSGNTWSTPFYNIKDSIVKFLVDENNPNTIYLATKKKGIFKTENSGVNWNDINSGLKEFKGYNDYRALFFNSSKKDSLILVCKYGLLKTEDGGISWTSTPLLTSPGKADIKVAMFDPIDDSIIYYVTKTTFYKTVNSGSDWITKKMFSSKSPTYMMTDPENSSIIYMGFSHPAIKK
ncbi:hypothetical protein K8R61_01515 [bacterium]|nr:hypothetical protein [bacterium]